MASINKVILVGNLGADPETRYTTNGDAICNIRLATTDTWKDKSTGEKRETTEWHRVVFYRKLAETANQFLRKGSQIYVEGRIKTRKWQDKDGQDRYTTEIEASEMVMLGGRSNGGNSNSSQGERDGGEPRPTRPQGGGGGNAPKPQFDDLGGDDIPFVTATMDVDSIHHRIRRTC